MLPHPSYYSESITLHSSLIFHMRLSPQIVIPFFSLLIKDIYFLNEGCANRLPNGHVNFEVSWPRPHFYTILTLVFLGVITLWFSLPQKFVELARQVGEFMTWKQVECPFEEDRAILHYLHTAPIFSEDGKNSALLISLPLNGWRVRFRSI